MADDDNKERIPDTIEIGLARKGLNQSKFTQHLVLENMGMTVLGRFRQTGEQFWFGEKLSVVRTIDKKESDGH